MNDQIETCYVQFLTMSEPVQYLAQVCYASVPGWCCNTECYVPAWYYAKGCFVGPCYNRAYAGVWASPVYRAYYDHGSRFMPAITPSPRRTAPLGWRQGMRSGSGGTADGRLRLWRPAARRPESHPWRSPVRSPRCIPERNTIIGVLPGSPPRDRQFPCGTFVESPASPRSEVVAEVALAALAHLHAKHVEQSHGSGHKSARECVWAPGLENGRDFGLRDGLTGVAL